MPSCDLRTAPSLRIGLSSESSLYSGLFRDETLDVEIHEQQRFGRDADLSAGYFAAKSTCYPRCRRFPFIPVFRASSWNELFQEVVY